MKQQVAVQTSVVTVPELSSRPIPTVLEQRPVDPLKAATALQLPAAGAPTMGLTTLSRSPLIATLVAEAATAGAPTMGLTGGPAAGVIAAAEAT
jgi:hypothetical protein